MQEFPLSTRACAARPQPIGYLMSQGVAADMISLAAGLVDPDTLPSQELAGVLADFMRERGRTALQYGTNEGLLSLRRKVILRLADLEGQSYDGFDVERVLISTGSQQMLYILTEVMVDPGDVVITAAPSYFVYLGALENFGARVVGIPADEDGMRMDALRSALVQLSTEGLGKRVKVVYLTTYFDNPAGTCLAIERRREILQQLDLFEEMKPLLIEDAAYRELAFDGKTSPSIWSYDDGGQRVAYLGTFSKPFSPGLRTGYAVLPTALVEKVKVFKCGHDFGSANFPQHLIDFAIERGIYDRHLKVLRGRYREKCSLICRCLQKELGGLAEWREPQGGLYVWVDAGEVDTGIKGEFFAECAREGVLYVPGEFCYGGGAAAPRGKIRLSFGPTSPEDIEKGVARLGAVLSRHARKRRR